MPIFHICLIPTPVNPIITAFAGYYPLRSQQYISQFTAFRTPSHICLLYTSHTGYCIKSHYSDSPILHRTDFLFTGIRRNNHQTASCIPSGNRHCSDWTFSLDSSSIYTCRNLFQRKSSESCETLWSRLPHSHRYHVICCHPASRPPMRLSLIHI